MSSRLPCARIPRASRSRHGRRNQTREWLCCGLCGGSRSPDMTKRGPQRAPLRSPVYCASSEPSRSTSSRAAGPGSSSSATRAARSPARSARSEPAPSYRARASAGPARYVHLHAPRRRAQIGVRPQENRLPPDRHLAAATQRPQGHRHPAVLVRREVNADLDGAAVHGQLALADPSCFQAGAGAGGAGFGATGFTGGLTAGWGS